MTGSLISQLAVQLHHERLHAADRRRTLGGQGQRSARPPRCPRR
jgi:hypothetical protein